MHHRIQIPHPPLLPAGRCRVLAGISVTRHVLARTALHAVDLVTNERLGRRDRSDTNMNCILTKAMNDILMRSTQATPKNNTCSKIPIAKVGGIPTARTALLPCRPWCGDPGPWVPLAPLEATTMPVAGEARRRFPIRSFPTPPFLVRSFPHQQMLLTPLCHRSAVLMTGRKRSAR